LPCSIEDSWSFARTLAHEESKVINGLVVVLLPTSEVGVTLVECAYDDSYSLCSVIVLAFYEKSSSVSSPWECLMNNSICLCINIFNDVSL